MARSKMAKLPLQQAIYEIKNRIDIVNLIGRYINIKRQGRSHVAVCPFHDDHKPSMHISASKGIYKCFACGAGGDIYKFVQDYTKVSFIDAVKELGKECGIEIESKQKVVSPEQEELYSIHQYALDYFKKSLNANQHAHDYLTRNREFSTEIIQEFSMGFAPEDINGLSQYLDRQGFKNKELLIESGLCIEDKYNQGQLIDRFRNRIIIPIFDLENRCIAFGGRILDNSSQQAKYLNSPETKIFHKGQYLFNLNKAREFTRQEEKILLLEGYFDVIKAWQHGLKYTVACLGTGFSKEQAQLLYNSNLSRNVIFGFDMDSAGINASKRALEIFQEVNFKTNPNIKFLELINSKDIDEYLTQQVNNTQQVQELIDSATDIYEFFINRQYNSTELDNSEAKQKSIYSLIDLIKNIQDPIKKEFLAELIANKFSITKQTVLTALNNQSQPLRKNLQQTTLKKRKNKTANNTTEKILLSLLFLTDIEDVIKYISECNLRDSYLLHLREEILSLTVAQRRELLNNYQENNSLTPEQEQLLDILAEALKYNKHSIELIFNECREKIEQESKAISIREKMRNISF